MEKALGQICDISICQKIFWYTLIYFSCSFTCLHICHCWSLVVHMVNCFTASGKCSRIGNKTFMPCIRKHIGKFRFGTGDRPGRGTPCLPWSWLSKSSAGHQLAEGGLLPAPGRLAAWPTQHGLFYELCRYTCKADMAPQFHQCGGPCHCQGPPAVPRWLLELAMSNNWRAESRALRSVRRQNCRRENKEYAKLVQFLISLAFCIEHGVEALQFAKPFKGSPSIRAAWRCLPGMSDDITLVSEAIMHVPIAVA